MSLKDFVRESDVRERLMAEFETPFVAATPDLRAPPLTKNYSLVGTAFDYLLRFYIERLNPGAKTRTWIAEEAAFGEVGVGDELISLDEIVNKAKRQYKDYLLSGNVTDDLLAATLKLGQLDPLRRRGDLFWDSSFFGKLGRIDPLDITDLKQLIALVNPDLFRAAKCAILNPAFGRASHMMGGADCDLVIDDTLLEIKTTKRFAIEREYFNQLIGYYLLSRIGKIAGAPPAHSIRKLGIYFSRFGYLWTFDVTRAITESRLAHLTSWFKKRAQESKRTSPWGSTDL